MIDTIATVVNQHLKQEHGLYFALMDCQPEIFTYDYYLRRPPGHRRLVRRPEHCYRFTIIFQDDRLVLSSNAWDGENVEQLVDLLTAEYANPGLMELLDSKVRERLNLQTDRERMVGCLHEQIRLNKLREALNVQLVRR